MVSKELFTIIGTVLIVLWNVLNRKRDLFGLICATVGMILMISGIYTAGWWQGFLQGVGAACIAAGIFLIMRGGARK